MAEPCWRCLACFEKDQLTPCRLFEKATCRSLDVYICNNCKNETNKPYTI